MLSSIQLRFCLCSTNGGRYHNLHGVPFVSYCVCIQDWLLIADEVRLYWLKAMTKWPKFTDDGTDDNKLGEMFKGFCQENLGKLKEKQLRRVTFIVWRQKEFPKYFTFRWSSHNLVLPYPVTITRTSPSGDSTTSRRTSSTGTSSPPSPSSSSWTGMDSLVELMLFEPRTKYGL